MDEIIDKFNLPPYIKGKTFAEASKLIENKFKDRSDKISLDTKNILLKRLAEAQEAMKESENPSNQFSEGGDVQAEGNGLGAGAYIQAGAAGLEMISDITGTKKSGALSGAAKGATAGAAFGPWGAAAGALVSGVTGMISDGKAKKEMEEKQRNATLFNYNSQMNGYALGGTVGDGDNEKNKNKGDAKTITTTTRTEGDLTDSGYKQLNDVTGLGFDRETADRLFGSEGSQTNSTTYPQVNLGKYKDVGYFDINKNDDKGIVLTMTEKNPHNYDTVKDIIPQLRDLNPNRNVKVNYKANGGFTNDYNDGGKKPNPNIKYDVIDKTFNAMGVSDDASIYGAENLDIKDGKSFGQTIKPATDFLKDNYADILRYSPIASNLMQLNKLDKPSHETLDRLDNRYEKQFVDEKSMTNAIDNTYNMDFAREGSGGSLSSYLNNSRGAQLNKTRLVSEAYMNASNLNRQEERVGQEFNANVDKANLNQSNAENDINARNLGAYNTAKSQLQAKIGDDLGDVGKEEKYKQMIKESGLCYDSRGAYICGNENERISDKDLRAYNNQKSMGGDTQSSRLFSSYLTKVLNRNKA